MPSGPWDLVSPTPSNNRIVLIAGHGGHGKTYLTRQIYHIIRCGSVYRNVLLFDPFLQIDSRTGYQDPEAFIAALDRLSQPGQASQADGSAVRPRVAVVADEADWIWDQWAKKDDIREKILKYNRHLGLALYLNFRAIPSRRMLDMATDVCIFNTRNDTLVNLANEYSPKESPVDLSGLAVGQFVKIKI